jgi:hypothetical protein
MKPSPRSLIFIAVAVVGLMLMIKSAGFWRKAAVPEAVSVARKTPAPLPTLPSSPEENRPTMAPDPGQRITVSRDTAAGEAPIEHLLRGVLAANAEDLKLSPAEIDRLVALTLEYQEIHTELIARYLRETSYDPGSVTLHVPPFPMEGKALRDMYHRRLQTDFPQGKAEAIREHIGGFIDESFRGFGIADQTFTLTRSAEKSGAFEVSWEVKVPEGQSPSGPNPGMSYAGSSGKALLTREQITSGEYRFLTPVLERRFATASAGP